MSDISIKVVEVLLDGSVEETTLDAVSDIERTFIISEARSIFVLPKPSAMMRAIAQRAARNIRFQNALRQEIEIVEADEREELLAMLKDPKRKVEPLRPPVVITEPLKPIEEETSEEQPTGRVMREVAIREEAPTPTPEPQTRVPKLKSLMQITDEDFLVRIFGAYLLGAPLKEIKTILSSAHYSEAQRSIFDTKINRLLEQFQENIE